MPFPKKDFVLSEELEGICNLFDTLQKEYRFSKMEMERLDNITQDYLHKLELEETTYKTRAKIATQLSCIRKERRTCKDRIRLLDSLNSSLNTVEGKRFFNLLKESLGNARKEEKAMNIRRYYPRVLQYYKTESKK